ncbi:MAG: diguanylate cyclase, partial [Myxococcota bacterium]
SYDVEHVSTVSDGLNIASKTVFDACVVDYHLGDDDGLNFIARLRARDNRTPCVILTGDGNPTVDIEAMKLGAVDYLHKDDLAQSILERSVRYAIERGRSERALLQAARRDSLTDLHNRTSLYERLETAIERYLRWVSPLEVLFMDLVGFKSINDSLGHHAGDWVLRTVAERLQDTVRPYDLVARVGGDEFVVVIDDFPEATGKDTADTEFDFGERKDWLAGIADRIFSRLGAPIRIDADTVAVGTSIGIAVCPKDGVQAEGLLQAADRAMYRAKRTRSRCAFYEADVDSGDVHTRQRASYREIGGGFLDLAFQPQICLNSESIRGCEALLRWTTSSGKKLTPHECLPVFRRQGILHQVGDGVRERAASQAAAWHRQGLMSGHISVNVSAAELCHPALPGKIEDLLDRYQIQLELELTESELIHDDLRARSALARLRALGVRIAVDDFGSGFSSLQRIRTLPFDVLKVECLRVKSRVFEQRPSHRRRDGSAYRACRRGPCR